MENVRRCPTCVILYDRLEESPCDEVGMVSFNRKKKKKNDGVELSNNFQALIEDHKPSELAWTKRGRRNRRAHLILMSYVQLQAKNVGLSRVIVGRGFLIKNATGVVRIIPFSYLTFSLSSRSRLLEKVNAFLSQNGRAYICILCTRQFGPTTGTSC